MTTPATHHPARLACRNCGSAEIYIWCDATETLMMTIEPDGIALSGDSRPSHFRRWRTLCDDCGAVHRLRGIINPEDLAARVGLPLKLR